VCGLPCAKNMVESVDAKTLKTNPSAKRRTLGKGYEIK